MEIIKTQGLTKYYGKARGIIDVDLSMEEGDFFGFIGPNGAGKSTFIRLLLGLISSSGGSACVFGKNVTVGDNTEILADIGYLPSEAAFYGGMRVSEMLEFSAKLRKKDCSAEAKLLCERLELDTSRKIDDLSLGNRKKVGIVCALQHKPRLYILDEPTSGLDPLMQREFYSVLEERNKEGATVFLSSHILSEVGKYCRNAAVIREGRILAADSVRNLGNTGVKRVSLFGTDKAPALSGIKDCKVDAEGVKFLYGGDAKVLLAHLSELDFEDISISDPDLDEVFMHYYTREEK